MAFIRVQGLRRNEAGTVIRGTASILRTIYDPGVRGHSRHEVVECLGRIVTLSDDRRSGTFLSETRGLVSYDAVTGEFRSVTDQSPGADERAVTAGAPAHVTFADVYLLICFLQESGLLRAFRSAFTSRALYERFVVHLLHEIVRDGSHMKCDVFFRQSVLSWVLHDIPEYTLRSDSEFFRIMGQDETKMALFKALTFWMRTICGDFGNACYVDSTPLPNDISDNPYNALRCGGSEGCSVQMRLALVLDQGSGVPVWYTVFPGNLMDVNTLRTVRGDLRESLGVTVTDLVLDAGYCSRELLEAFPAGAGSSMLVRMPARRGYPFRSLYHKVKAQIPAAKYDFERRGHIYFGRRFTQTVQDQQVYAYVYVDKNRALEGYARYCADHPAEFGELKDKDKRWRSVEAGYFVLLSNRRDDADRILWEYISRTDIEAIFKDSKTFLRLLPLAKWTDETVRGKILTDIMAEFVRTRLLHTLPKYRGALSDLFDETMAVGCFRTANGWLHIDTGNRQARAVYKLFGQTIPGTMPLADLAHIIFDS